MAEVFKAEKLPFAAVIDKTGSIVLCKKVGQLSSDEWKNILTIFEKGERSTAITHTTGYREKKPAIRILVLECSITKIPVPRLSARRTAHPAN
ncbi:MAG: hypothetical protein MKZ95_01835 [Pirellulales bacterium]|nr:hypothetical protein [Pirellulales bacterium]